MKNLLKIESKIKPILIDTIAVTLAARSNYFEYLTDNGEAFFMSEKINGVEILDIRPQQCFRNSALIALARPQQYEYWEGFYLCECVPLNLEHAWNRRKGSPKGVICDATAQVYDIPVEEWFGVKLPYDALIEWQKTQQFLSPLQHYFRTRILETAL